MTRNRIFTVLMAVIAVFIVVCVLAPNIARLGQQTDVVTASTSAGVVGESSEKPGGGVQSVGGTLPLTCSDDTFGWTVDIPKMAAALANSGDPEHLLMASLYGGEQRKPEPSPYPDEPNLDSLFKGLQIDPRNELLLWNALTLCAKSSDPDRCEEENVPELATTVLGDNANFWLRLAAIRAEADDHDGALAALEQAVVAPTFQEYFIEHVKMFARGMSAFENPPFGERIYASIGMAAALWQPEIGVITVCKEQASLSTKWLAICIDVGEVMEARGQTFLTEAVGTALQKNMYEFAGDARLAESAASRRQTLNDELLRLGENTVFLRDKDVLATYIDEWEAGGERQAQNFLNREARRLRNTPGYDPCARY